MATNKKCLPGVICVENVTLFFIVLIFLIIFYLFYISSVKGQPQQPQIVIEERNDYGSGYGSGAGYGSGLGLGHFTKPTYTYSNLPADVLMNPYEPPLRDERYFMGQGGRGGGGRVPINVSTNVGAVDTSYRQMGILTPLNGSANGKILPLMGRPLFTNRDKWQYYAISDQNNSVKLPVSRKGRSCTNEYGCDSLYNGDTIYVEGYKQAFKITMYDNDTIKYLPFL